MPTGLLFLSGGEGMPVNPMARVYTILDAAFQTNGDEPAFAAWAKAFGVTRPSDPNDHASMHEIARLLGLAYDQLELGRQLLEQSKHFTPDTYDAAFTKAERAMMAGSLNSQWNQFRQHLTPDVLALFKAFAQMIPNESLEVSSDEWQTLLREVNELEEMVRTGKFDEDFKLFIFAQLDVIRRAVREYPIRGPEAFKEAAFKIMVVAQEHPQPKKTGQMRPQYPS